MVKMLVFDPKSYNFMICNSFTLHGPLFISTNYLDFPSEFMNQTTIFIYGISCP